VVQLIQDMAKERERDTERALRYAHITRDTAPGTVVIRLARSRDEGALRRLAALDGRELTWGRWLCAQIDGTLVAALELDGGALIADPFRRTETLRRVLEVWAAQLTGRRRRRFAL
jgi:hypothetical protein